MLGVEALVLSVVLWLVAPWVRRRRPELGGGLFLVRLVAAAAAFAFMINALTTDRPPGSGLSNPVQATVDSVTAGAALYQASCAVCHGADARGGGPGAGATAIPPPDLRSGHLVGHTDGEIFTWITRGLPGGMPAWGSELSETERWHLVNFLRSINGSGPTPAPSAAVAWPLLLAPALATILGAALAPGTRRKRRVDRP